MEVEPIQYRLENLQFKMGRAKTQRQTVMLGSRLLSNEKEEGSLEEWDRVTSIVAYNASYRFYWGHITGLIRALSASASTLSYPQQNQLNPQNENKVYSECSTL